MSDINKRIVDILKSDDEPLNENQMFGGITGFAKNDTEKRETFKRNDARRKRIERQSEQRLNKINKSKENGEEIDPRTLLTTDMRFTLKESFLLQLLEYGQTGKYKYIEEAVNLMNEYPKLKTWVMETSHKALPTQAFSLYTLREWFTEDVGTECERVGDGPHIWSLSENALSHKYSNYEDSMVLECRVSPNKVLIYLPAFSKMLEEFILSGKIMETIGNPIREIVRKKECVTENSINKAMITRINKGNSL